MRDDTSPAGQPPQKNPYDMIGGEAGVRRLVDRFYDIMDSEPEATAIRAMHAADLSPMRQRLFEFMSGWLGGPRLYNRCVMSAHQPFAIGTAERDQWLKCMQRALTDIDADPAVRKLLEQPLFSMADAVRNR
ncbi:MAG: globin [Rhodospirillaceae bacterium]|nr:MAG: globin [Rhodospirillaceae bacterium]